MCGSAFTYYKRQMGQTTVGSVAYVKQEFKHKWENINNLYDDYLEILEFHLLFDNQEWRIFNVNTYRKRNHDMWDFLKELSGKDGR